MTGLPPHLLPLLRPETYSHAVNDIRLIETHISWVLLTGEFAYKLKRPVHYPFIDLRSPARRAFCCAEEIRLNARFAPQLYLGVSRIICDGGRLRVAEQGEPLEHAVRMRQFDGDDELDRLIESGHVDTGELENFGRDLAVIHAGLPRVADSEIWGSNAGVQAQLRTNLAECRQLAVESGTEAAVAAIGETLGALLARLEPEIAARRQQDNIRECHGDLHARNIVRYQGRLVAFDCIEFEPAFRWIDVAEEIAFLWMDLRARRRADLAHAFLCSYLMQSGDFGLCRMLRLYGAHRALVRAKVAALEAGGAGQQQMRATGLAQHRDYLDGARQLLEHERPILVIMTGPSGSGKTWLARQLVPLLAAVHLSSDVERKRLAGFGATADSHSAPGGGLYTPATSRQVYEHLARCANATLAGDLPVIVDGTFAHREERTLFANLAADRGVELVVVNCQAPRRVLEARIIERRRGATDASEADVAVLEWQLAHTEPIAADESLHVIDADTTRATIVAEVRAALPDSSS
ncbi:MAG: AAA family ATPase [Pseudomonadota bacterium]